MSDQRITQLTALSKAGVSATDVLPIADISATETKKVTVKDLVAAGIDLVDSGEIDLSKLDQNSATKIGTTAIGPRAVVADKLGHSSSVALSVTTPVSDNFEGRGYFNTSSGNLQIFNGTAYQQVVVPTAGIGDLQVTTGKLADGAVTTAKVTALGAAAYADGSVTASKIADGAITTAKIAADSVTASQIAANAVGASELADNAVDTASIANLAVTEGKLAAGSVTNAKLGDLSVTDGKIANATITYEKLNLADNSVPGAKVSNGSITSTQLASASVETAKIANNAVTTAKIADDAVTAAKIGPEAVDSTAIGAGAVTNAKIASAAVTYSKIQDVSATDRLLGRSSVGAGPVEEIPLTSAGRALLDDADAAAQRATLGLGSLATQSGTFSGTHSGSSSGTNTGDQTITLTGDVTGSGASSFAATIANAAVTEAKVATNAISTDKIVDDAVTGAKLNDNSAIIVSNATPSGSGSFVGQQWVNTATGFEYTWTGSVWQRQAAINTITFTDATPLAYSVSYPDGFSANVDVTLDTQAANRVFAGPTSGADAAPTFRTLQPADLPDATSSTKGIVQPGTGLTVASGTLNHTNSATAGTYPKVTIDAQGHVTTGATLEAADIPSLDTSKITTGAFSTALIANHAVTGAKLADYATAQIGEALPTADFIGQIFFNPLDKSFYLWDGNVWQPIGVSLGELVFAGTYDANINEVLTTTTVGAAVGLAAGDPLPTASSTLTSYYVVVAEAGTGTSPAPAVTLAPPDIILCDGANWTEIDVSSTYVAQTAANVGFSPAGTIASTNVQNAIEEVASEAANANNLTSGIVSVGRGGTGTISYAKGDLLAASASTTLSKLGVGANGQVLRANSATATGLEWGADFVGTVTSVTGSGAISVANSTTTPAITVASASTSTAGVVQLSDSTNTTSSTVAATSTAVKAAYDLADAALPKAGGTVTGNINLDTNVVIVFEGTTADAFEISLSATDPTADRTISLPDVSGTIVTTGDTGTVTGAMIADNTITNAKIASGAAIVDTKLATISTAGKVANSATTATSANTASAIVARDASGNFSAGTISAALSGNASTATALATARNIQGVAFDGTANITVVTAGSGISVTGTAVANTGVLSVNGSAGAITNVAVTNAAQSFTAAQRGSYVTLTDAATVAIDLSLSNNYQVTLGGNRTIGAPTNVVAGQSGVIRLVQDATGSRTASWNSAFKFPGGTAPTLTTTANAVDLVAYHVESATRIAARFIGDVK